MSTPNDALLMPSATRLRTKPYLTKGEVKALIARRDSIVAYFDNLIAQKGKGQGLY